VSLLVTETCFRVGGLWDASALRLDVVGGVVAHRDVFWSGGGLWGMPASHLGLWKSWVLLLVTKMCLGMGVGSGMHQPRIWDRGTSWVSLLVTETCLAGAGLWDVFGSGAGSATLALCLGSRDVVGV
jgi:hypothetical protein